MTSRLHRSATNDPRTISNPYWNIASGDVLTPLQEKDYHAALTELTERVETLVNYSGQLHADIQDRPVKYNAQIRDLDDDHYELTEPVLALIEEYPGDTFIASLPEIEAFGEGSTESEAVLNLKHAILDLYDELSADPPESLGELPKAWLRVLQKLIREI
jgi:hypothetical protein